tara:strand:+ start:956 stop:1378 length:423 start_codon:yes stop_codon:yes gene_type:complete
MKKVIALGLLLTACSPVAAQDNVNLNAQIYHHYELHYIQEPYKVKVCGDKVISGDKTGDTLGGAILGGLIGKALTGQDDGAKIGALFGGIIGHNESKAQSGTQRVCHIETRYREKTQNMYSHSIITWRMNGREYNLRFQK